MSIEVQMTPVVLEDRENWLALSKPSGMSVHNRRGSDLISWVADNFNDGESFHPLHRLDTGTSGIVLFAKNKATAKTLHRAFEDREIEKVYQAIAVPITSNSEEFNVGDRGDWKWSLTKRAEGRRDPRGYARMRVPAMTSWSVDGKIGDCLKLTLSPHTGRKHQLRRHAAIAGIPLLGDGRYGIEHPPSARRPLALHASQLTFTDPESGAKLSVNCPPCEDFFQI